MLYGRFFDIDWSIWNHLWSFVLPEVVGTTFLLVGGVGFFSLLWGVSAAWLVTLYDFPGRKFLSAALVLPLSFPLYITAFVYVALFDGVGLIPTQLGLWLGRPLFFPSLRNPWGGMILMSFSLYPYIYMLTRNALEVNALKALEVGATLGLNRHQSLRKIILPLIRPWVFSGLTLVIMETLADFGAVSLLNLRTFSVAIYRTWFGLFSLDSASQLAALMVTFIFFLVFWQQQWDLKKRFWTLGKIPPTPHRVPLLGMKRWGCWAFLGGLFFWAFLLPLFPLVIWGLKYLPLDFDERYLQFIGNSVYLSVLGSLLILIISLVASAIRKKYRTSSVNFLIKLSTLGYAIPGTVLAVGIFIPFSPLFSASVFLMILGYFIRFLSIGISTVDSSMEKITQSHRESVKMLGLSRYEALRKIYWPMLKTGIFTTFLLCFVEIMKEMPITLMMRPFGKETLSVRIFELTSEGEWSRAALPSLFLVLIGPIPLLLANLWNNWGISLLPSRIPARWTGRGRKEKKN